MSVMTSVREGGDCLRAQGKLTFKSYEKERRARERRNRGDRESYSPFVMHKLPKRGGRLDRCTPLLRNRGSGQKGVRRSPLTALSNKEEARRRGPVRKRLLSLISTRVEKRPAGCNDEKGEAEGGGVSNFWGH